MALNTIEKLYVALRDLEPRIEIEEDMRLQGEEKSLDRDAGDGERNRRSWAISARCASLATDSARFAGASA